VKEFSAEVREQDIRVFGGADEVSDLTLRVDGLGEGAQAQPDDRAFEPVLGRKHDELGRRRFGSHHPLYT
jgi:hypothetical protein